MMAVRRLGLLALFGAFAAAACGSEEGSTRPSSVALLTKTSFVEYDTTDYGAEASEMEFTIRGYGVPVTPVIAYDSASIAQTLAENPVFVVPEQEGSFSFVDSLTPGALTAIRNFVDNRGGILIVATDSRGLALINTLFGYTLAGGSTSSTYLVNSANTTGTSFTGGPALIWEDDQTRPIDPATLPTGAKIVYQGANNGVAVAYVPRGAGVLILNGWDWYNAEPHGSQDGGWIDVFQRAIRY